MMVAEDAALAATFPRCLANRTAASVFTVGLNNAERKSGLSKLARRETVSAAC